MEQEARFAYTSASERRERLAQYVIEQGYCTILELAQRLGVSEMTIRRDVSKLVAESRLRAFHGGVGSLLPVDVSGVDYGDRDLTRASAKHAIALGALRHVRRGSVVGIDSGTTAAQLAALIPRDEQLKIITPSLPAVTSLASNPGIELTCLGGDLHAESLSFAGPITLAAISNLHIDTLFLSASGLNERGPFCGNSFDAITKRALIDASDQVILIADSSKFGASAMVRICGWDAVDRIIVDDELSEADEEILQLAGVPVDRVEIGLPAQTAPPLAG